MVKVKIKNKSSEIKAVQFLGKYSQDKALLNETIKMVEFLNKKGSLK
jgi:hypothetical protein